MENEDFSKCAQRMIDTVEEELERSQDDLTDSDLPF
jgi:frataxin-like iron-binding protein CyaY